MRGHNGGEENVTLNEAQPRRWKKKWLTTTIKLVIAALVLWFIHRTVILAWQQLSVHEWQFSLPWLVLSGIFYLTGSFFSGLFWHRVLLTMGQPVGLGKTLRAFFIGHLGKYVPGKAMVVVLRTGFIRGEQVNTTLAAISVFFETLTMMAVGAFLSAAILAVGFREQTLFLGASLAMMCAAGVPILPPVFRRLLRWLKVAQWNPATEAGIAKLGYKITAVGWLFNTVGWVFLGLSLWAVLCSMGTVDKNPIPELPAYTASVSLATVAGFVSMIPSGAIVREAVLTELLGKQFHTLAHQSGEVVALVAAVLLRLVWLVSELVISGILYFITHHEKAHPSTPPQGE
jgi:uncharacterized membrane protein YbhN (UPF0104 family)